MPYLIDGHNLIGQLPDIQLDEAHDEAKLVNKLRGFCAGQRTRAVVVFDAGLVQGRSRALSNSAVEVYFTARPGIADQKLIHLIQQERDPRGWTVVSSDGQVRRTAQHHGMRVESATVFAKRLAEVSAPGAPPLETHPNPRVTPQDVAYWLDEFDQHNSRR